MRPANPEGMPTPKAILSLVDNPLPPDAEERGGKVSAVVGDGIFVEAEPLAVVLTDPPHVKILDSLLDTPSASRWKPTYLQS
jgi:hypothetical protein